MKSVNLTPTLADFLRHHRFGIVVGLQFSYLRTRVLWRIEDFASTVSLKVVCSYMDQKIGGFWSKSEHEMGVSGVSGVLSDSCASGTKHETQTLQSLKFPTTHTKPFCFIRNIPTFSTEPQIGITVIGRGAEKKRGLLVGEQTSLCIGWWAGMSAHALGVYNFL
ncbi:MAG: hypothetical protein Q4E41_02465 [Bacteroidales bacterium]|nr:hypothetical protein [Bacteroidales bacterium]